MKYENIRKQVLDAILEAVEQGLIKGTSGNIALRDDVDDVAAITPSGIPYKGMTLEDIALTIHAHPTLGEVPMEAAEVALGRPVHSM